MWTIFGHSFRRSIGAVLGWGISLGLLGVLMLGFYDTLVVQQEQLQLLLAQYPPEMMAFFGGTDEFFSPSGYLTIEFFSYMPLVIGIFAVLAGSSLLVSDEEAGIMDLVLAHPVSRSAMFFGRLLNFALSIALILGLTWLAFIAGSGQSKELNLSAIEMLRPFISLYAVLFFFGGFCLLLSLVLPSRGTAAMLGGIFLVASYFINSLAALNENLDKVAEYLPLRYYQSGDAINSLNTNWVLGLLGVGVVFMLAAWRLFEARDIRVSGEGSWRLIPGLARK